MPASTSPPRASGHHWPRPAPGAERRDRPRDSSRALPADLVALDRRIRGLPAGRLGRHRGGRPRRQPPRCAARRHGHGLVIGAGQALVSRRRLDPRWWVPATAFGMGLGLLLGAASVGYHTSLAELALTGALTGLVLGIAQAVALPRETRRRWVWAAAMPALWALGWTATT